MRAAVIKKWILTVGFVCLLAEAVPAQTSWVPTGSVWKFLDDGSDQGIAWQGLPFDDSAWASGPAPLGYGGVGEVTVVNGGPDTNRFITTYFRHIFQIEQPQAVTNLAVRLLRDAGGVVYLNGTEVFRSNIPTNEITFMTLASEEIGPGDESINYYTNAIDPVWLLPGSNILAVEIHQSSTTGTNLNFDLAVWGFSEAPPTVTITNPPDGARFLAANIALMSDASDPDDAVARVDYFEGPTKLGEAVAPPYTLIWSNVPAGPHTLIAVATDSHGLSSTSAPVTITEVALTASGSVWSYLDDGSDQGTAWQSLAFDDSGWATGPARLGYGEGTEATLINGGPSTNRFITYYFRRRINLADQSGITNLVVRLLRDDGGIVYLNGTEIFRSNMPEGPVDYLTWAASVVPNGPQELEFYSTNVNTGLWLAGENILAVEIHQANNTSGDLSFDLELLPNVPPTPPTISITSPGPNAPGLLAPASFEVDLTAGDFDGTIAQVEVYLDNTVIGLTTTEPYSVVASNISAGDYVLWAVATDDSGLATTSAPVNLTVAGMPVTTTLVATGSVWKYLDNGSDQGAAWKEVGFDDSGWAAGPGILGYGNSTKNPPRPEATLINCCSNPPSGTRYITDYFRHQFRVWDADSITNLYFRVLRDDGVVVYLNGTEIFRMNMTTNAVTYTTPSLTVTGGANETNYYQTNISSALLVKGTNLLAVELHQSSANSPDAAFDLELQGVAPPYNGPITLAIEHSGSDVVLSWRSANVALEQANHVAGPWSVVTNASSPYQTPTAGAPRYFRLHHLVSFLNAP